MAYARRGCRAGEIVEKRAKAMPMLPYMRDSGAGEDVDDALDLKPQFRNFVTSARSQRPHRTTRSSERRNNRPRRCERGGLPMMSQLIVPSRLPQVKVSSLGAGADLIIPPSPNREQEGEGWGGDSWGTRCWQRWWKRSGEKREKMSRHLDLAVSSGVTEPLELELSLPAAEIRILKLGHTKSNDAPISMATGRDGDTAVTPGRLGLG